MSETIFDLFSFKIYTIGLFIFLGLSLGHFLTKRIFGKETYFSYSFPQIIIFSLLGGLILETLRIFIFQMQNFKEIGVLFDNASFTSVATISFIVFLLFQRKKLQLHPNLDLIKSINLFFFFVITSGWLICLGLYFDGHGYGLPTSLPWGVTYNSINSIVPYTVPIHPTQIYMAIIFFIAWILASMHPKESTNIFFISVAPVYFLVDFIKGDSVPILFGLSLTQYITLISLIIFFYYATQKLIKHPSLRDS